MDWQDHDSSYLAVTICTPCDWELYLTLSASSYKAKCASKLLHSGFTGHYGMYSLLSDSIEDGYYELIRGVGGGEHRLEHGGVDGPHKIFY